MKGERTFGGHGINGGNTTPFSKRSVRISNRLVGRKCRHNRFGAATAADLEPLRRDARAAVATAPRRPSKRPAALQFAVRAPPSAPLFFRRIDDDLACSFRRSRESHRSSPPHLDLIIASLFDHTLSSNQ